LPTTASGGPPRKRLTESLAIKNLLRQSYITISKSLGA
jgi:hypothetical protein